MRDKIKVMAQMKNMKNKKSKIVTPAILLAAFIALAAQGYYSPFPKTTRSERVIRVIDGDTVETASGAKIRLAGIGAPEYPNGCLSLESRNRLEQFTREQTVRIEKVGIDHFGREVSYLYNRNLDVNKAMVSEGYAMVDTDTKENKKTIEIETAQREAQAAKRNIWSAACENTQKPGCVIKGNYRKDNNTYIYHLPGCYNYEKIVINTHERDRWFCTEDEATAEGFMKSGDCPR